MIKELLHLFGIHDWDYDRYFDSKFRICKICSKEQGATYDLSGEKYWVNLK